MSYTPILSMALSATHIDIPAQSVSTVSNLTLGAITDASVVTVASNIITLPAGRSYFITGGINWAQTTGTTCEFSICTTAGVVIANSVRAYAYYGGTVSSSNQDTYAGDIAGMLLDVASTTQIVVRKTISSASTTIYKDNASSYYGNSGLTILYTD